MEITKKFSYDKKNYTNPNAILRMNTDKITVFGSYLHSLLDDMIEAMNDANGDGLAAPQVGVSQKVIIVVSENKILEVVNPEITFRSYEIQEDVEECLSIPGFAGTVGRNQKITIRGYDRNGQRIRYKSVGWLARIFQHEIDHINGILFTDRTGNVWKIK